MLGYFRLNITGIVTVHLSYEDFPRGARIGTSLLRVNGTYWQTFLNISVLALPQTTQPSFC